MQVWLPLHMQENCKMDKLDFDRAGPVFGQGRTGFVAEWGIMEMMPEGRKAAAVAVQTWQGMGGIPQVHSALMGPRHTSALRSHLQ